LLPVKNGSQGEWFSGFLREVEIQDRWGDGFLTALEKGYPEHVCERLYVIGKFIDEEIIAHTSFADMGTWYFIGNNYVKPKHRKNGILKEMVQRRNSRLAHYPKIAILRPIEDTDLVQLTEFLQTLGYSEVLSYADVSDVMLESEYELISDEELWRCD
tara:strand:- start:157 stop:630 length:474 start_codon:yes stop_codon:yes gene_type:complete